jgi:hypothetical protein
MKQPLQESSWAPSTFGAKNVWEPKKHLGGKKKAREAPTSLYEPTFSNLSPTGHVNLLMNVKVISS